MNKAKDVATKCGGYVETAAKYLEGLATEWPKTATIIGWLFGACAAVSALSLMPVLIPLLAEWITDSIILALRIVTIALFGLVAYLSIRTGIYAFRKSSEKPSLPPSNAA